MVTGISVRALTSLLASAPGDDVSMQASQLVYELDPEFTLPVGTQPAAPTAETLHLKYSFALVFFTEDATELIGILCVTPPTNAG